MSSKCPMREGSPLKNQTCEQGLASSIWPSRSRRTRASVTSTPHLSQMTPRCFMRLYFPHKHSQSTTGPKIRAQNSTGADSRLWNELIQRHHYLGYRPLSGAQMRYLVWSGDGRLLAALGFGACAWHLKPRDQYIGWDDGQRRRG